MKIAFKWIRVIFCVYVISPYGVAWSAEPVRLRLTAGHDESLIAYLERVYCVDAPASALYVNRRFNLGPTGGQGDLELVFAGLDGEKYEMGTSINSISLKKRELVSLNVYEFVGVVIPLSDLKDYYQLLPGEYFVKGRYRNSHTRTSRPSEFIGVIESETVRIVIR